MIIRVICLTMLLLFLISCTTVQNTDQSESVQDIILHPEKYHNKEIVIMYPPILDSLSGALVKNNDIIYYFFSYDEYEREIKIPVKIPSDLKSKSGCESCKKIYHLKNETFCTCIKTYCTKYEQGCGVDNYPAYREEPYPFGGSTIPQRFCEGEPELRFGEEIHFRICRSPYQQYYLELVEVRPNTE